MIKQIQEEQKDSYHKKKPSQVDGFILEGF